MLILPSALFLQPDLEQITRFAEALNFWLKVPAPGLSNKVREEAPPVGKELRRLVQAWRDSGPDVAKLLTAEPGLAREANHLRFGIVPTRSNYGQIALLDAAEKMGPSDPSAIALGLFFLFLLNPYNVRLGGPCPQCGKYFPKLSDRHRVYCRKECGLKHTSRKAIARKRRIENQEKLSRILRSISEWQRAKTSLACKEWISKDTGIKKNWITRAVKKGLVTLPDSQI